MARIREATIDDLYHVEGKAEIVNGELVLVSPDSGLHGYAAGVIFASPFDYARRTKLGNALPDNVGFVVNLENRRSFSPDARARLRRRADGRAARQQLAAQRRAQRVPRRLHPHQMAAVTLASAPVVASASYA